MVRESAALTRNLSGIFCKGGGMSDNPKGQALKRRPARELLHELEVHQIELNLQNEALRRSQVELEKSRDRYADFYDFAPVGFLTLNQDGLIEEINLTGAALFGVERSKLLHHNFTRYVSTIYRDRWHIFFLKALKQEHKQTCELAMQRHDGSSFHVQLDCLHLVQAENALRIVLTDITERRNAEEALRKSNLLLKCISKSQDEFIAVDDPALMFGKVLDQLLVLTKSEYGFIAETLHDENGAPYIVDLAISNLAWDRASEEMYRIASSSGLEFHNLKSLFGAVLSSGKPVIANDPAHDARSGGIPNGHPPLNSFLGVPFYKGVEQIGIFCVANNPDGYDEKMLEYIQPFTDTLANMLKYVREEKKHKATELERMKIQRLLNETERIGKVGGWEFTEMDRGYIPDP
jgi:PAS domain S-box-containing protein